MDNKQIPKPGWNNWNELATYIAAVQQKASATMNTISTLADIHNRRGDTSVVKRSKIRIPVECMECGKKFQTTKDIPECPKCGGVDVDVR